MSDYKMYCREIEPKDLCFQKFLFEPYLKRRTWKILCVYFNWGLLTQYKHFLPYHMNYVTPYQKQNVHELHHAHDLVAHF